MAENFTFSETGSSNGAADDIAGVKYQKIKLVDGTEDSTTAIEAGGGVEASALRVTLANDSTGVISIDDGGNTITVDGSITADVTGSGDVPITLDSEIVAVNATGQGDVPITLSGEAVVLGAGTAAIGKLAVNSGIDIGDVDVTSISAGTNNIGTVTPYAQPANFVSGQTADITGTVSTSVIAAQGAGVVIYITSIMVTNADADTGTVVKILDGSTTLWRGYAVAEGGGFAITFPVPLKCTANTAVNAQCETTGATVQANVAGYKV